MKLLSWVRVQADMILMLALFAVCTAALYGFARFGIEECVPVALTDDNMEFAELDLPDLIRTPQNDYIKWVSFDVPLEVLKQAYRYDVDSYGTGVRLSWIELIAYGAAKNWGDFKKDKKCADIDDLVIRLKNGESLSELTLDLKLYKFYLEAYSAVLGGLVGEYEIESENENSALSANLYTKKYGLKAFSPIANGYSYTHYDDFGVSRTYGYRRKHLGHDLIGTIGTPIIAVEGGYVEALGWNQYGGWRIGIRSFDHKRYYYYAHLRKDHPYHSDLKVGDEVRAGDVIGYLGMTGYSSRENTNNISTPHLHFGLQIIFDESQKDGANQIWIDVYHLVDFLSGNRMSVIKDAATKEYRRKIN